MAKFAVVAFLFCFVLFLFAAASNEDQLKWCPKTDVFTGGCGGPQQEQCLLDFLGKFGASSMPKNCKCTPSGTKHSCTCQVVCGCC
ncbi:Putative defensin-like protein 244 [Linum grandiflorum]